MTIAEAVSDVYLRSTGKTTTLTTGSKYNRIIGLLDFYQRRWAREPLGVLIQPSLLPGDGHSYGFI